MTVNFIVRKNKNKVALFHKIKLVAGRALDEVVALGIANARLGLLDSRFCGGNFLFENVVFAIETPNSQDRAVKKNTAQQDSNRNSQDTHRLMEELVHKLQKAGDQLLSHANHHFVIRTERLLDQWPTLTYDSAHSATRFLKTEASMADLKLKKILAIGATAAAIDYLWIGQLAQQFYIDELGTLIRRVNGEFTPILWAAVVFYVAYAALIVHFVRPILANRNTNFKADDAASRSTVSKLDAFKVGAVFGVLVYMFYDFTNLATLQGWSMKMLVVDIVWGGFLTGAVTALSAIYFPIPAKPQ